MYHIIKNQISSNGGVNNVYVIQILNERLQIVKSFNSKISYENIIKKAENWVKKNSSIKNQLKMSTKKPTPKQLEARKRFAEMAKSGELSKKREAAAKKKKTGLKKPASKGLTTLCAKTVGVTGRRKKDGTQKKGYVATKGGTLKKKLSKGLRGQSSVNVFSLSQYKSVTHRLYDRIKVKTKSGKIFEIYKTMSTTYSGNSSKLEGYLFTVKHNGKEVSKRTKQGIISYLSKV